MSVFAYYYEVKSRDRITNIHTLAHSHAHLQKCSDFPRHRVAKTYLNRMLLPIDFTCVQYPHTTMDTCQCQTFLFSLLCTAEHMHDICYDVTSYTANACTTCTTCSVVGLCNVMTLTALSRHRDIVWSCVDKRQSASIGVSHENDEYKTYC
jgi:hypothetical protein